MTAHARAVLTAVWNTKGTAINSNALFDAMYADDVEGGPYMTQCYADLRRANDALRVALSGSGVAVATLPRTGTRNRWCLRVEAT